MWMAKRGLPPGFVCLVLAACVGIVALTVDAKTENTEKTHVYLTSDAFDVIALLPPPPLANSPEARMEQDVVTRVEIARTAEEIARAKSEHTMTMDVFSDVVGPWFTQDKLPEVAALYRSVAAESKQFIDPAKSFFHRPRPSTMNPKLNAVTKDKDVSYPSGHSTRATAFAMVLAELLPELKDKLLARGQQIGWDRVIAGSHYPSDVQAGRVLGQAIARALLSNPDFRAAMEKARAEINAARPSHSDVSPAIEGIRPHDRN